MGPSIGGVKLLLLHAPQRDPRAPDPGGFPGVPGVPTGIPERRAQDRITGGGGVPGGIRTEKTPGVDSGVSVLPAYFALQAQTSFQRDVKTLQIESPLSHGGILPLSDRTLHPPRVRPIHNIWYREFSFTPVCTMHEDSGG